MPGSALLDRWLRIDYRPFDSGQRAKAALLAPIAGPFVVGLFAAAHEWFADATPYSTDEIVIGYTVYGAGFSYLLCAVLGLPYALLFDRWLGMPRIGFLVGAGFIGLCTGWFLLGVFGGWIFAASGLVTALTYILLTHDG